jgi:hypothetical protein
MEINYKNIILNHFLRSLSAFTYFFVHIFSKIFYPNLKYTTSIFIVSLILFILIFGYYLLVLIFQSKYFVVLNANINKINIYNNYFKLAKIDIFYDFENSTMNHEIKTTKRFAKKLNENQEIKLIINKKNKNIEFDSINFFRAFT